ncbi:hypothetical protein H310_10656 [Aphanomyces invadans]|uniref:AMP-dependent synthetase/ligase domain-containing protein n=1 Tax=Aphanomyces invadans TaxID=157072 RepID=A0A024TQV4_9STRA|nr:hypothetical protein H310_10656 [Aphanomyces invadans]ETV96001.1 hypothetical protein H310_10656 [Aphanomyces invadans]|eukprot:XP_008875312.1 hypothetical protein H310_10656 [Aphanomyces invadans]
MFMYGNYAASSTDHEGSLKFTEGEEYMHTNIGISVYPGDEPFRFDLSHSTYEIDSQCFNFLCHRNLSIVTALAKPENAASRVSTLDSQPSNEGDIFTKKSRGPQVESSGYLIFEARATRTFGRSSLKWLSYGELNAQADTLACELAALGVCVGSRVAVVMERCLEILVGLLAVLKVGATMMPVDATFPQKRIVHMLKDAGATLVVSAGGFIDMARSGNSIDRRDVDVRDIGRQTSFFALGGDSISVIRVVATRKNAGMYFPAATATNSDELEVVPVVRPPDNEARDHKYVFVMVVEPTSNGQLDLVGGVDRVTLTTAQVLVVLQDDRSTLIHIEALDAA